MSPVTLTMRGKILWLGKEIGNYGRTHVPVGRHGMRVAEVWLRFAWNPDERITVGSMRAARKEIGLAVERHTAAVREEARR